jgi:hypothetical protein
VNARKLALAALVALLPLAAMQTHAGQPMPGVEQPQEPVKLSRSGICHAPGSTYDARTKNFTPFPNLEACLRAGGRMPKR